MGVAVFALSFLEVWCWFGYVFSGFVFIWVCPKPIPLDFPMPTVFAIVSVLCSVAFR